MSSQVKEVVELRLTPAQMAAIIARIERRKRRIVECGQIDLGNISSADGSDLMQACMEAAACGLNKARAGHSDIER